MRRRRVLVVLAGAVAVWGAVPLGVTGAGAAGAGSVASLVPAASARGLVIGVPGLGGLAAGGEAQVYSVSCASAGNCAAGGSYPDRSGDGQGFVASERNGVWGRPIAVPGLAALSAGRDTSVSSVSCASAGTCAANGYYRARSGRPLGFVASQRNGVWGRATAVPGLGTLIAGGEAQFSSVSCGSAGNCAVAGSYYDRAGDLLAYVASQRNGKWGRAIKVPGLAALDAGRYAQVYSVSCGSAANCAVGGSYVDRSRDDQGFVVSERNGKWGRAAPVPGLAALNKVAADVLSVSCGPAGNCAAGGSYYDRSGHRQGWVATGQNGRWGRATPVPGLAALNTGHDETVGAEVGSVSCAPAGGCTAGGYYSARGPHVQAFVVSQRNGKWGRAAGVPGLSNLNAGGTATVSSVSCASAGNCTAGGAYTDRRNRTQGWVATEQNGRWGKATGVPGLGAMNTGAGLGAGIIEVSCGSAGDCAAGGYYTARGGHLRGFVASQRKAVWGRAIRMPAS